MSDFEPGWSAMLVCYYECQTYYERQTYYEYQSFKVIKNERKLEYNVMCIVELLKWCEQKHKERWRSQVASDDYQCCFVINQGDSTIYKRCMEIIR